MVSTHLKNISQNGNLPQIGMNIKNIWNHHLGNHRGVLSDSEQKSHERPHDRSTNRQPLSPKRFNPKAPHQQQLSCFFPDFNTTVYCSTILLCKHTDVETHVFAMLMSKTMITYDKSILRLSGDQSTSKISAIFCTFLSPTKLKQLDKSSMEHWNHEDPVYGKHMQIPFLPSYTVLQHW